METPELTPEQKEEIKNKYKEANQATAGDGNETDWDERIASFFKKISFLEQTPEQKAEISLNIKDDVLIGKDYWIEIVLSSFIATFGLLQNSVAVIIGAMLIAPLLRPIQGVSYGIAQGQTKFFWRSAMLLLWSVVVSIAVAYAMCLIAPLKIETPEILARTSPNLFDLFIATGSAVVALLAHSFKKLSESVAGVAMAASLMPPLAVVGIEISLGFWDKAFGSFLLFFTNLVAILLVGAVVFVFYGFHPHLQDSDKTAKNIGALLGLFFILWIPLMINLDGIATKNDIRSQSKTVLTELLDKSLPTAKLNDIEVQNFNRKEVQLAGEIRLPENVDLFGEIIDAVTEELSEKLKRKVTLDLNIVRTAKITSKEKKFSPEEKLSRIFRSAFGQYVPDGIIITLQTVQSKQDESEQPSWTLKAAYTLNQGQIIDDETQAVLEQSIRRDFGSNVDILWVPISKQSDFEEATEKISEVQKAMSLQWEQFLSSNLTNNMHVEQLSVQQVQNSNKFKISFHILVPYRNIELFSRNFAVKVDEFKESFTAEEIELNYRLFPFYNFERGPEPDQTETITTEKTP